MEVAAWRAKVHFHHQYCNTAFTT